MSKENAEAGYENPRKDTRFKKGQSGNPTGRPRYAPGFKRLLDAALKTPILIPIDGQEVCITMEDALIKKLVNGALTRPWLAQLLIEYEFVDNTEPMIFRLEGAAARL